MLKRIVFRSSSLLISANITYFKMLCKKFIKFFIQLSYFHPILEILVKFDDNVQKLIYTGFFGYDIKKQLYHPRRYAVEMVYVALAIAMRDVENKLLVLWLIE